MCEHGDTVIMQYDRRPFDVDCCIAPLVKALNDAGILTIASCCGHKNPFGVISLRDAREMLIFPTWEATREAERLLAIDVLRPARGQINNIEGVAK